MTRIQWIQFSILLWIPLSQIIYLGAWLLGLASCDALHFQAQSSFLCAQNSTPIAAFDCLGMSFIIFFLWIGFERGRAANWFRISALLYL